MCGIGLGDRPDGKFDGRKILVLHRPEYVAPCRVQCIDRRVLLAAPVLKRRSRGIRRAQGRVVAAQLVIGLPADHGIV